MTPVYKTVHRVFFAWNYQAEIESLNKASDEGWQLAQGGSFSSRFVKDEDVRYRYQIDYGKVDDMGRYLETFREQGWEYINSTFNGWRYFRKVYDPALPEEEYEIFTDRQSLREMTGRWSRIALIIAALMFFGNIAYLIDLIKRPCIPAALSFAAILIEVIVLLYGAIKIGKPEAKRSVKGDTRLFIAFVVVLVVGLIGGITLRAARPNITTSQQASSIDAPIRDSQWTGFEVKYTDNYYLDLKMNSDKPMTYKIVSEDGSEVYSMTSDNFSEENICLRLEPGHYWNSISADTGFTIDCELK